MSNQPIAPILNPADAYAAWMEAIRRNQDAKSTTQDYLSNWPEWVALQQAQEAVKAALDAVKARQEADIHWGVFVTNETLAEEALTQAEADFKQSVLDAASLTPDEPRHEAVHSIAINTTPVITDEARAAAYLANVGKGLVVPNKEGIKKLKLLRDVLETMDDPFVTYKDESIVKIKAEFKGV